MIGRLGFYSKWIGCIRTCIEFGTISILVNGSSTKELKPGRDLRRQGDPMASLLFYYYSGTVNMYC